MAVTLNGTSGLALESVGSRITGDFSNTVSGFSRMMFQSRVADGATHVFAMPNSTANLATFGVINSNTENHYAMWIQAGPNGGVISATKGGTASYPPMIFATSDSEKMRITASGNVGIGTTTPAYPLDVVGNINTTGTLVMGSSFRRNKIINGDMRIDQRYCGSNTGNLSTTATVVDRWKVQTVSAKVKAGQNINGVTPPPGFSHYLGVVTTDTYPSPATDDALDIYQWIESYNISDLAQGTAAAKPMTASFWVRSSVTGVYTFRLVGGTGATGAALTATSTWKSYVSTFTISTANVWQYVTFTVPGCTTGTWRADNLQGLALQIFMHSNHPDITTSTLNQWLTGNYAVASTQTANLYSGGIGSAFYITGVQLESGTVATPYEYQIFSDQLVQCQRYYEKSFHYDVVPGLIDTGSRYHGREIRTTYGDSSGYHSVSAKYKVEKRGQPTPVLYSGTGPNSVQVYQGSYIGSASVAYDYNGTGGFDAHGFTYAVNGLSACFFQWTVDAELI